MMQMQMQMQMQMRIMFASLRQAVDRYVNVIRRLQFRLRVAWIKEFKPKNKLHMAHMLRLSLTCPGNLSSVSLLCMKCCSISAQRSSFLGECFFNQLFQVARRTRSVPWKVCSDWCWGPPAVVMKLVLLAETSHDASNGGKCALWVLHTHRLQAQLQRGIIVAAGKDGVTDEHHLF